MEPLMFAEGSSLGTENICVPTQSIPLAIFEKSFVYPALYRVLKEELLPEEPLLER